VTALRGVLVEAAFARGLLPGEAERVRDAMGETLLAESRHPLLRLARGLPRAALPEVSAVAVHHTLVAWLLAVEGAATARDVFLSRLEARP
jgi:hypothetical protein